MMANTIWKELNKRYPRVNVKKYYFYWKNGLKNRYTDFTVLSEDEFIKKYCAGSKVRYKFLQEWEKSEEYNELMQVYMNQEINSDIYEVYKVIREKALQGDDKAIKTLLMLQKEVKKNISKIEKGNNDDIEDDDGLTID